MTLTIEQKTKIVEFYLETKSWVGVKRAYQRHFNVKTSPDPKTLREVVMKFRTEGTVHNLNKKRSGRPKTVRTVENVDAVRQSVTQSPNKSLRRRSQELGLTRATTHRILRQDLNCFPYKIHIKHKLTDTDKVARVAMCNWFNEKMERDQDWIKHVWFTDEAHFHLAGQVNSRNNVYWGTQPPLEVVERPLHSAKVTVWCALSSQGIIGPYFLEDEDGHTVTINQQRYRVIVRRFCSSLEHRQGVPFQTQWFMQDGATPHTANQTLEMLRDMFDDRVISRRTENPWAPHSPDLTPLDFFLWGYAKDNVFKVHPNSLQELKEAITDFVGAIPQEMCERVIENFAVRVNACLNRNGAHIEHII